ncbi:hypothetical protein DER29_3480 [Micromonospora sp. M71_S20]|uniref:DUF5994 family protein n=1 Tax=Micromonospora sp. M71_S20 TaxID=592872 RepID=UPI000F103D1C|nr:DUF5994 family protein [Micromonospora sp. M71_S20]RLK25473.1 hypothetical protein DER29_3480 [Micromonospora sp. M71_S20]
MTPSPHALAPPSTPRLRIQPTRSTRTLLDGGWWPRSTDPLAELPGLVLAIDLLHGPIVRLVLNADAWDGNPRHLTVDGRVLRLGHFTSQPATLLTAICRNDDRVDLLVVPPETPAVLAEAAMALAATAGNLVHSPQLLVAAGKTSAPDAVAAHPAAAGPAGSSAPTAPPPRQRRTGNRPTITTKEQTMTISRNTIVAALRRRGQHTRADWVERELPAQVDTSRHAGLLATLRLDLTELGGPAAR